MRRMTSEAETVPKYEEMFAHRFTTADKEYQEVLKSPPDPPPIVEDWRIRTGGNRRSRDFQPYRRQDDSRNWSNERQWRGRVHGLPHTFCEEETESTIWRLLKGFCKQD
ncbi:RNA guanine-N7 methyltransferase activating subunit-like isoform X2 [Rhincodon typus]|uniref:RNA guanine-N7 methyltransferase activating subunit-like isoform X2 n=1 Tax=Rhincodon typus TaxID=259920 RepID=UPI00202E5874|nr:RNA guanine-N7 methyltransferase activating subunit-like isoform X2 [Rhincodon typus]